MTGAARLVAVGFDRPRAMAVALLALLAVVVLSLPGLRFDDDINRVFLSDSPLSRAHLAFEDRFATRPADVALLVEAEGGLTPAQLARARDVALELEFVPGVLAVTSPFALRFPPGDPDFPDAPVFPAQIEAAESAARLAAFRARGFGLPVPIADDALLIVAAVDSAVRPLEDALPEIAALADGLTGAGLTATLTGPDVASLAIRDGLARDLGRLNLLGAALVVAVALLLLRDWRLTVVAVAPALLGAVATLALTVWLGLPVTVLSNVLPVLMLILGVANGMHLAHALAREQGDLRARVVRAARAVAGATALTAATTALAFGSILLADNAQLRDFALIGAGGVSLTLLILLPGFGLAVRLLAPAPRRVGRRSARLAQGLARPALHAPRGIAALGFAILVIAGWGFATTEPAFPLSGQLPSESPVGPAAERVAERFGGAYRAWVEMPSGATWAELTRAVSAADAVAPGAVLSEVALARWLGEPDAPPDATLIPPFAAERLRDPQDGTLRFAFAMPEPMRSQATLAAYDRLEGAVLDAGAAQVVGLPAIMRHESVALIAQLSWGLVLACLSGAAVVAAAFRSLGLLPAILAANLLPLLLVGAALHGLTGGLLTPPAVLSLTIAFGIAIDDTVHFLAQVRAARERGADKREAVRIAVGRAGAVMVATTVLLAAGLAVTAFSAFPPVRLFGAMLGLSLLAALLADLVLLPAMLLVRRR